MQNLKCGLNFKFNSQLLTISMCKSLFVKYYFCFPFEGFATLNGPPHGKTNNPHRRIGETKGADQLRSNSPVRVRPGRNPNCWFSHAQAHQCNGYQQTGLLKIHRKEAEENRTVTLSDNRCFVIHIHT